jgi:uncharacterized protein YggE
MTRNLLILLAAAMAGPSAVAQTQPAADARFATTTLDVSAEGEARLPPDMATLELGVTTEAASAKAAADANAQAMARVIAALRGADLGPHDIQTSTLSLSPQYAYRQGEAARLTGYQATNEVTVRVTDLARLEPAIDAAVGAGATDVAQISFGLKSPDQAENLARFNAVKALQDKAVILADAAGYHIRRLVNLQETSPEIGGPRPFAAMALAKPAAPATPIETGEVVVRVELTGEFELTHQPETPER